jgi:hypothetical protein
LIARVAAENYGGEKNLEFVKELEHISFVSSPDLASASPVM